MQCLMQASIALKTLRCYADILLIRQLDFVCTNAGAFSHEPNDIQQLQMRMAELRVLLNNSSHTTQTAHDLGAVSSVHSLALQMTSCSAAR